MKIIEIAQEIYISSLNSPSDLSVSSISFWLRENIGLLNNDLAIKLTIGADAQLSRNLTETEKAIYKLLYLDNYYSQKIRENLGASGTDAVVEISNFGTNVRKISKNEVAKSWLMLKKANKEQLDEQVRSYNINDIRPVQCVGDDTTYSLAGGLSNTNASDVVD